MLEECLNKNNESDLYHKYYWSKNLKNWLSKKQLRRDVIDQVNYPIKPGIFDITRKAIFEVLDAYSCVVPYDPIKYENIMRAILDPSREEAVNILVNHENFATMLIIIKELYKYASIINKQNASNKINLKKNVYIVFWSTISTQSQIIPVQSVSNGLKTIPSGDDIPGIENTIKSIRSNFIKQLFTITKDPNNIVIMAPTGTRDVIQRNSDWTVNAILFKDDTWIESTAKIIKSLVESWTKIILVWTNGTGLKRPGMKKVTETNNNRTTSDVYIDIQELSSEECLSLIEDKKLMETIGWLVRDHNWNSIAKIVNPTEFDTYKNLPQQIKIQESKYQNYYFQDTIYKKIVRKLYMLFK